MSDAPRMSRAAWSQVALAALGQNLASGLAFGSFGTIVLAIEQDYGAARASSALAISAAIVTLSMTAMVLGQMIDRIAIRTIMIAGALVSALAFLTAGHVHGIVPLIAAYALLLGPGTAMLGIVPTNTLAARWAPLRHRGLAMGIVNMPAMVMVVPLLVVPILQHWGIRVVYQTMACVDFAAIAVLVFVRDVPGVQPCPASQATDTPEPSDQPPTRRAAFWLVGIAQGLIVGAGTVKLAHFIPLLIDQGHSFAEANMLLALSGGAGLVGSFLFGALADRIGGVRAMICNAFVQAVVWTVFLAPVTLPVLVFDAIVVGACAGGIQGAFGVAIARLFGTGNFGRVLGYISLMTLPFLFGMPPLAGLLFEMTGTYRLSMGAMIILLLVAGCILMPVVRRESDQAARRKHHT
jgi:MFS family permease